MDTVQPSTKIFIEMPPSVEYLDDASLFDSSNSYFAVPQGILYAQMTEDHKSLHKH